MRPCTQKDFGLGGGYSDEQKFSNVSKQNEDSFNRFLPSMKCTDDALSLYGDWTTTNGKVLYFQFLKCNSTERSTCKNDTEVKEWFKNK